MGMKIQSLSVVVPNRQCINNCAFCVSKMHGDQYKNQLDENLPFYDLYVRDYIKRLEFARDNGCNTVMLTGNSEPQQNRRFLKDFGLFMLMLERPFRNIEMQTTGIMLDEPYLRFLRNHVGVNTISLSLSSLNYMQNSVYNGFGGNMMVGIADLCEKIKKYDFTLRLSLNLTDFYNSMTPHEVFAQAQLVGADQVTFRVLYKSPAGTPQDEWIDKHAASPKKVAEIHQYIETRGTPLERLEFGALRYSIQGLSVVHDDDCMSKEAKAAVKYLILQPDCKLYSKWDDPASLVF